VYFGLIILDGYVIRSLFVDLCQDVSTEVPLHDTLRIHVKGYDFTVVESFAKYVHKITDTFGLDTSAYVITVSCEQLESIPNFSPAECFSSPKCLQVWATKDRLQELCTTVEYT